MGIATPKPLCLVIYRKLGFVIGTGIIIEDLYGYKNIKEIGVNNLEEIDSYKFKLGLDYLYIQKSGQNDAWQSNNIKTIVHSVYPQKLKEVHGDKYAFISVPSSYAKTFSS